MYKSLSFIHSWLYSQGTYMVENKQKYRIIRIYYSVSINTTSSNNN